MGAKTDTEQAAPTVKYSAVKEGFSAKIQRAFALGWHIAELHYLPTDIRDPATPQDPLARVPDLEFPDRTRLLTAQISNDLYWLDIKPSGEIFPLGAIGPIGSANSDAIPVLDSIEESALAEVDAQQAKSISEMLHRPILLRLTVMSAELGKAYSLGVGLARTVFEAYEEVQQVLAKKAARKDEGARLRRVKECVAKGFTQERVLDLWSELKDLKSLFPPYAADPIAAGLSDWCKWAGGSQTKRGQPSASMQIETVSNRLRRQGQVWRALLSGERKPTDVLLAANYIDGAIDLVRKYSGLVVRMLGKNLATVLAALFTAAILSVVVILLQTFANISIAVVTGLLAALGVSGAGIMAALRPLAAKAEQALWETELTAAIGVAINYVPALPKDSEVVKLRGNNASPTGPVVEATSSTI